MKQILLLLLAVIAILNVSAQSVQTPSAKYLLHQPPMSVSKHNSTRGNPTQIGINYDSFDYANYGSSSSTYSGYLWIMNSDYVIADTAGATSDYMKYAIVTYDSIFDYSNNIPYVRYDYDALTIDSIYYAAGWEQNSVNNDTQKVSIIEVNSAGYPTGIVWWDTLIITSLGSTIDNQWNETTVVAIAPNFPLPPPPYHFAVKLEYFGDVTDTFAFGAGFPISTTSCGSITAAAKSTYYPNSYAYWLRFSTLLPTSTGGDVYTDCNHDGMYEPTDGANYIQNIDMTVILNLDATLGANRTDPDVAKSYVFPNPANDNAQLSFTMPNASTNGIVNVYDITGKVFQTYNLGHLNAGKHIQNINTSDLASGIYMYSIATDNGSTYGKFVKQ